MIIGFTKSGKTKVEAAQVFAYVLPPSDAYGKNMESLVTLRIIQARARPRLVAQHREK